jgi:hypothetical protein
MPNFSSLLLILALQPGLPPTPVNFIPEMKRPFFGCAEKADLEHLVYLMTGLPQGAGRRDDVLSYGRAHCIPIPRGFVSIERSEGDFSCIRPHSSRGRCLWVPRGLIGDSTLDDGVF